MAAVSSEAVAQYIQHIESLARSYIGFGGAEFDDLRQEGMIDVWLSLARGITPSSEQIENRMKDWVRYLRRQTPIPYEALLPLDDYSGVQG